VIVEVYPEHPEPRKIRRAVEALRAGEVIAYPTELAYALGCSLYDKAAIEQIYQLKGVPRSHPLAFVCADLSDVARYCAVDQQAYRVLKRTLPGPYTFILEATREVPKVLHSRRKTVGVRVPAHAVPIAIVRELGHPVLSTTAGRHGEPPLLDARDIDLAFPRLGLILDGGIGSDQVTTVVDLTQQVVVREGAGPIDVLF
jgi:tRNA threonylcarbamoyl adenosine modification protein (Sua5/YciO/YrdC/YwlC family)